MLGRDCRPKSTDSCPEPVKTSSCWRFHGRFVNGIVDMNHPFDVAHEAVLEILAGWLLLLLQVGESSGPKSCQGVVVVVVVVCLSVL